LLRLNLGQNTIVWTLLIGNALMGMVGVLSWKFGVSEQVSFLTFLAVTVVHMLVMRNAWRFIRIGRRILKPRRVSVSDQ
jgi:UDP-GlcNAc:undecaprenyl-phosphate GlcNAc-1-phosphate transferase